MPLLQGMATQELRTALQDLVTTGQPAPYVMNNSSCGRLASVCTRALLIDAILEESRNRMPPEVR